MNLQELVTRGRLIFSKGSERLKVFELINGKRNTEKIAQLTKRHVNNIRRDLQLLLDGGLIQPKIGKGGNTLKIEGFPVYEKVPLARTLSLTYFRGPIKHQSLPSTRQSTTVVAKKGKEKPKPLPLPTEKEILDICRQGEDQIYEFKGQGTDVGKISREIAAMLNTRQGGMILYGIDDSGTIQGTDISRQKLDQPLQNSIRNTISPAATIKLHSVQAMGYQIHVVVVPPWNKRDIYHYEGRVLIRKGTNVFTAKPEESKRLHKGDYII